MKLFRLAIPCLALGLAGGNLQAAIWAEVGDAGQLPGTAQITLGANPLTAITGTISAGDADMYLIYIPVAGAFSATTVGGAAFDTQLFLFTAAGMGVATNDDNGSGLLSTLPAGGSFLVSAGNYYLAISGFNNDPTSVGGLIFPSTFPGVFGATGPGAGSPVSGWTGGGGTGAYTITLTGAQFAVPEPGSVVLLAGIVGLIGRAIRRKQLAA